MKNANAPKLRNRGMKTSSRGSSPPSGYGFSRPAAPREIPRQGKPRAESSAEPFAPNPVLLLPELHALDLDHDRAQSYLAKPGCNVVLGMAHLVRAMIKRSQVLQFLQDDRGPARGFADRSVAVRLWATGTPAAIPDGAEPSREGSPARCPGRSRRGTAMVTKGDE